MPATNSEEIFFCNRESTNFMIHGFITSKNREYTQIQISPLRTHLENPQAQKSSVS